MRVGAAQHLIQIDSDRQIELEPGADMGRRAEVQIRKPARQIEAQIQRIVGRDVFEDLERVRELAGRDIEMNEIFEMGEIDHVA